MEIGERQAKGNEKNLCLKGWETLVINGVIKRYLHNTERLDKFDIK